MCGIVGVIGNHQAAPLMIEALKRMEYRGYDSAGIATIEGGRIDRRRAAGKLANLSDLLVRDPLPGRTGIGHTRWATHGAATLANAHPHRTAHVAVVHNGIIENHDSLARELTAGGAVLESETDSEIVAHLVERGLAQDLPPLAAVRAAAARLEGAFALVFLFEADPDMLVATRCGSPLAIGHGEGEMFVGSDALALAPFTRKVTYLEEGEFAVLTRGGVEITTPDGTPVVRAPEVVDLDVHAADRAGYRHFMEKEMFEQPAVLARSLEFYLSSSSARGAARRLAEPLAKIDFAFADRLVMVGCGTAHHACMVARYWFESLAGIAVDVDIASEFRYRDPILAPGTLALFVSQSGETADTLAALRYARRRGAGVLSVVNVPDSSIARESDVALPILAGPEIGVASTKAFTGQLMALAALALEAAHQRGRLDNREIDIVEAEMRRLPALMSETLGCAAAVAELAREVAPARDVLFLGRGPFYPMALEAALKLKEISYIHAEGYAAGELKHGPLALVDKEVPVILLAPSGRLFGKALSNLEEVAARGGKVVLISDAEGIERAGSRVWRSIVVPSLPEMFAPILHALPVQMLAYHVAVEKGTDIDQPRNLAKSVVVE